MQDKHPLPTHHVRIKKLKSLLAIVENSIKGGNNYMFRNLYANEGTKEIDILEDGKNSCAVFVSWILLTLELIKHPHASVFGIEKDLIVSGWFQIKELKPGAVLIWEEKIGQYDGIMHLHMGFYVGDDQAVSNSSQSSGFPIKHHVTYNDSRQVEKIYWHPELDHR